MRKIFPALAIIGALMTASVPAKAAVVEAIVGTAWAVNVLFLGATTYEQAYGRILTAENVPNATDAPELAEWSPDVAAELAPTDM